MKPVVGRNRRTLCQRGFTLVEMLVTLALLALLATAVLPMTEAVKRRANEADLRRALVTLRTAIDAYKTAYDAGKIEREVGRSGYPATLRTLVDGVPDISAANGGTLYFLRRMPADPFYAGHATEPENTWETRSYDSDPDSFTAGDDVFDVRSTSTQEGNDGRLYNEW